jgi:hypothetical protein
MDDYVSALIAQLRQETLGLNSTQANEIVRQARAEAEAEVKALLKETMVRAMLVSILGRPTPEAELPAQGTPPAAVAELGDTEAPAADEEPSSPETTGPEEDLRREIEAIRQKISENERLLQQASTPAAPTNPATERDEAGPMDQVMDLGLVCYLYAVMSVADGSVVESLPAEGIDPAHPVFSVRHRDLQAIVSQVPLSEFGQEELEKRLDDLKWMEDRVCAHQRVLDVLVALGGLVPMRFCTIYRSEDSLRKTLDEHYDDFVATLARLKGKQEWGVKVYCDEKVLAQKVEDIDPNIKERRNELSKKSGGATYFMKKKLDETVLAQAAQLSDEKAQYCHDQLSTCCVEAALGSLQNKAAEGDPGEMVLNGAYLVAAEQWLSFDAALQSLNAELGPLGFRLELTGPWAPYNFTTAGSGGEA